MQKDIKIQLQEILKTVDLKHITNTLRSKHQALYKDIIDHTKFIKSSKFSERIYCIINNITLLPVCSVCGSFTKFIHFGRGYAKYCSSICALSDSNRYARIQKTISNRYGVTNISQIGFVKEKKKIASLKKFGTEFPIQNSDIKQKIKETCLARYGSHPNQRTEFKDICKNTNLNKYGVEWPIQLKEFKEKSKKTCFNKYGVENIGQAPHIQQMRKEKMYNKLCQDPFTVPMFSINQYKGCHNFYSWKCNKCLHVFTFFMTDGFRPRCPSCFPSPKSTQQTNIYNYINNILKVPASMNLRKPLKGQEIDVYIPSKKIGFEYHGLYWHTEISGGKERQYHINKLHAAQSNNINLIQIFEDEWLNKQQIVKARIRHILGGVKRNIYARKCIITNIDNLLKNKFLNKYHIQGKDKSSIKLGAFYKNKLIAVMTFGQLRSSMGLSAKIDQYELIRFCTISNFNIVGIAGKILMHFIKNYKPTKILSYADLRWSQGNLYYKLGFDLKHISPPNYWYWRHGMPFRLHRYNFRKNILSKKLETFDPSLSEWQNMQNNGYDRIWDCGSMVFELMINNK